MDIQQDTTTSDVTEATESTVSDTTTSDEGTNPLSYEKGVSLSDKLRDNPDASLQELIELDKIEKFRFNGKTLTPAQIAEWQKNGLRQADYTKKTQEIAEERKFSAALSADLRAVRKDPALRDEFLRVYPKKFHEYLEFVTNPITGELEKPQQTEVSRDNSQSQEALAPKPDPRVDEVYNWFTEQRQEAAQVKVDALFDRLTAKFPEADEGKVIAQVQSLINQSKMDPSQKRPDDAAIEALFKAEHEKTTSRYQKGVEKLIESQRTANARGRGPGVGGATPGQAPKVARTIKEATEFALSDPGL